MTIHSIGQFTDMHLSGTDTQFIQRTPDQDVNIQGNYTLVFTASNPEYYWGNYIIFSSADCPMLSQNNKEFSAKLEACKTAFQQEFDTLYATHVDNTCNGGIAKPKHIAITWDVPVELSQISREDSQKSLADSGFTELKVFEFVGLMALPELYHQSGYEFRSIGAVNNQRFTQDWQQVVASKIASQGGLDNQALQAVIKKRYDFYRQQTEKNQGMWFGAFDCNNSKGQDNNDEDKLIASLGVFVIKKEGQLIARFQDVDTHPDYQRQGLCRNLIRHAVKQMQQYFADDNHDLPFYIMASAGSDAERVYRDVGFEEVETIFSYESTPLPEDKGIS